MLQLKSQNWEINVTEYNIFGHDREGTQIAGDMCLFKISVKRATQLSVAQKRNICTGRRSIVHMKRAGDGG